MPPLAWTVKRTAGSVWPAFGSKESGSGPIVDVLFGSEGAPGNDVCLQVARSVESASSTAVASISETCLERVG